MDLVRLTLSYDACDDQWIVHVFGHKDSVRFDTLEAALAYTEAMARGRKALELAKAKLTRS